MYFKLLLYYITYVFFFFFRYTVAKNGGEYWVGKESETITLNTATAKKN